MCILTLTFCGGRSVTMAGLLLCAGSVKPAAAPVVTAAAAAIAVITAASAAAAAAAAAEASGICRLTHVNWQHLAIGVTGNTVFSSNGPLQESPGPGTVLSSELMHCKPYCSYDLSLL